MAMLVAVARNPTCIRYDITDQQLHKGGFAGAIPAQQADPLAGLDLERNAIQQP
jgi:hypothetical protein